MSDIEQVAACIGDCQDSRSVTVNDVVTLVNIALGSLGGQRRLPRGRDVQYHS